jgi:hypothetical protein
LKVAKRRGEFTGDIPAIMPNGFDTGYSPRDRFLIAIEATRLVDVYRYYVSIHAARSPSTVTYRCSRPGSYN